MTPEDIYNEKLEKKLNAGLTNISNQSKEISKVLIDGSYRTELKKLKQELREEDYNPNFDLTSPPFKNVLITEFEPGKIQLLLERNSGIKFDPDFYEVPRYLEWKTGIKIKYLHLTDFEQTEQKVKTSPNNQWDERLLLSAMDLAEFNFNNKKDASNKFEENYQANKNKKTDSPEKPDSIKAENSSDEERSFPSSKTPSKPGSSNVSRPVTPDNHPIDTTNPKQKKVTFPPDTHFHTEELDQLKQQLEQTKERAEQAEQKAEQERKEKEQLQKQLKELQEKLDNLVKPSPNTIPNDFENLSNNGQNNQQTL